MYHVIFDEADTLDLRGGTAEELRRGDKIR